MVGGPFTGKFWVFSNNRVGDSTMIVPDSGSYRLILKHLMH